jgi:ribosomal protein S27E
MAKDLNNETVKIKSAQQLPKKTKIKCPGCGVTYEVTKMETYTIRCMDCGAEYLQAIHNVDNPEFIRAAAYRCRG